MKDNADLNDLAQEVRALDSRGVSDEEIASCLKDRTASFGESGKVLVLARQLETADAYGVLRETETWRAATAWYHITTPAGPSGRFSSPNGRTFSVGDTMNLPNLPEPPHKSEPGRGTVWRVVAIEPESDPGFIGRLVVEPVKRLELRD